MPPNQFRNITRSSTKTFYNAILFFPREVREDVFILYSFLRTADDLVDSNPPQIKQFKIYKQMTLKKLSGKVISDPIINAFGDLIKRKKINHTLVTDFFHSLEIDLKKKKYETFEELKEFTYGVAEVVGLLMSAVMNLPKKSHKSARKLGLAMQLVNIMRDINEDRKLGRIYIPQDELILHNLPTTLSIDTAIKFPNEFKSLIKYQNRRINSLFDEAREGYRYIPQKFLIPISSAADIYYQTAKAIERDPISIFYQKIRLSKFTIMSIIFKNFIKINATF